jgi:Flp pilus assembly pilin Flp
VRLLSNFLREDDGQDLVEYSLLLGFVCLASAALFISLGQGIGSVFSIGNVQISSAASAANTGGS